MSFALPGYRLPSALVITVMLLAGCAGNMAARPVAGQAVPLAASPSPVPPVAAPADTRADATPSPAAAPASVLTVTTSSAVPAKPASATLVPKAKPRARQMKRVYPHRRS